jgi:hypothetical protein
VVAGTRYCRGHHRPARALLHGDINRVLLTHIPSLLGLIALLALLLSWVFALWLLWPNPRTDRGQTGHGAK